MPKNQTKSATMVRQIIRINLISIVVAGFILVIGSQYLISERTNQDYALVARTSSSALANTIDQLYDGDYSYDAAANKLYKGDHEITDDILHVLHEDDENLHHTIFWNTTRILSDITDKEGNSVVGTELTDTHILDAVLEKGEYTQNNVSLFGDKYTVSYYPLKNGEEAVGMMFSGVNQETSNGIILRYGLYLIAETLALAFVISLICITIINKKAKRFGAQLTDASTLADQKKASVQELGDLTVEHMEQINIAIDEITMAVAAQANHTEEIMGSMQEFGVGIDNIMGHIHSTADVSSSSQKILDDMKQQLDSLTQVSEDNSRAIANISKEIEDDAQAVADISKVIKVINDIAFQITILSFNASVEAARAGEAGEGFAVVAGSIKELSDKTKESLEGITAIVESVNDQMRSTCDTSSALISQNDRVIAALSDTKSRMDDVNSAFSQISSNIHEVSDETNALGDSKNEVVEAVSSLAAMSEENAAMSEEIKATADEVINTTHNLIDEIGHLQEVVNIIADVKQSFSEKLK